jgi:hypothetical protein
MLLLQCTLHVLDLEIDYLLVGHEALHDFQPFLASKTFHGPTGLPLRHGSSNLIPRDTDHWPGHGPKEKSALENTVGPARLAGARNWNLILGPVRHEADCYRSREPIEYSIPAGPHP